MFRDAKISGVNFINILRTAFALIDPKSVKNTVKTSVYVRYAFGIYERKSCTWNVDEIDTRCQNHQYFTGIFFSDDGVFHSFPVCVCNFLCKRKSMKKNLLIWWNWLQLSISPTSFLKVQMHQVQSECNIIKWKTRILWRQFISLNKKMMSKIFEIILEWHHAIIKHG